MFYGCLNEERIILFSQFDRKITGAETQPDAGLPQNQNNVGRALRSICKNTGMNMTGRAKKYTSLITREEAAQWPPYAFKPYI